MSFPSEPSVINSNTSDQGVPSEASVFNSASTPNPVHKINTAPYTTMLPPASPKHWRRRQNPRCRGSMERGASNDFTFDPDATILNPTPTSPFEHRRRSFGPRRTVSRGGSGSEPLRSPTMIEAVGMEPRSSLSHFSTGSEPPSPCSEEPLFSARRPGLSRQGNSRSNSGSTLSTFGIPFVET